MNAAILLKGILLLSEIIRSAITWHTKEERDERIERIKSDPVAEWNRRISRMSAMDDWPARSPGEPGELPAAYTGATACYRKGRGPDALRSSKVTAVFRGSGRVPPLEMVRSEAEMELLQSTNVGALPVPGRQSEGAAGYDLPSAVGIEIYPGDQVMIPTGWCVAIPSGYYGQIESRSGWVAKHRVCHRAGVIDDDYRGEIKVLLTNEGQRPLSIARGDRIAQLIIQKYEALDVLVRPDFTATSDRGSGGFGSTGGVST